MAKKNQERCLCETDGEEAQGTVEVDKLYVTAGLKGKRKDHRYHGRRTAFKAGGRGTYQKAKPPLVGMASMETGDAVVVSSTNVTGENLLRRIVKNVEPGAVVYHDDYHPYEILDGVYSRESVSHSAGEYAREDVHISS